VPTALLTTSQAIAAIVPKQQIKKIIHHFVIFALTELLGILLYQIV
jgi:hypothetical protein